MARRGYLGSGLCFIYGPYMPRARGVRYRHHDGASDGDVRHGVDEVGEEVGEDVRLRLEGAEREVDAGAHQERHVEARQREQQLVEDVAQLGPVCDKIGSFKSPPNFVIVANSIYRLAHAKCK